MGEDEPAPDQSGDDGSTRAGSDDDGYLLAPPETDLGEKLAGRRQTRIASLAVGNVVALAGWSYLSTGAETGESTAASVALGVWVLTVPLIVGIAYLDLRTARDGDGWTPKRGRWLLGMAIPTVGPAVAVAYVCRRRQTTVHGGEWGRWWLLAGLGVLATTVAAGVLAASVDPPTEGNTPAANAAIAVLLGTTPVPTFATYYDATELRTHGDAGVLAHRIPWSGGMLVWQLNLALFVVYAVLRRRTVDAGA